MAYFLTECNGHNVVFSFNDGGRFVMYAQGNEWDCVEVLTQQNGWTRAKALIMRGWAEMCKKHQCSER